MASSSLEKTKDDTDKEQLISNQIIESMKKEDIEGQRKEFQDYVAVHGVSGYKQFLDDHLNQWMKQPLRIVVTGSSGQGKSSLINTLRGLKSKSPGAAKVGVVECTNTVTEYADPKHRNLIYYDLPGVGTSSYPRDRYFEIIKSQTKDYVEIRDFDFFLIVSAGRFTQDDVWLAEQIQKFGKQFYFLRTKIDFDLRNDFDEDPDNHDELAVLKLIRDNCFKELNRINSNVSYNDKVFFNQYKIY
ncbi:unnamed protein product [Rotaria sp. Silwood2]|nr:unnamed protein product [Rotaria sp. Silwood2]